MTENLGSKILKVGSTKPVLSLDDPIVRLLFRRPLSKANCFLQPGASASVRAHVHVNDHEIHLAENDPHVTICASGWGDHDHGHLYRILRPTSGWILPLS